MTSRLRMVQAAGVQLKPAGPIRQRIRDGPVSSTLDDWPPPAFAPQLPTGYTYYPHHNDTPMTMPPETARIYQSSLTPPHLPRISVFHYLFPPKQKGKPPRYYMPPDPHAIAFIDGHTGRTLFRTDLPIQSTWLRSGIRRMGMKDGDVACIFGSNSLEWVSACLGAQAAQMVVSPAHHEYTPPELLHQLKDSGASLIFVQPRLLHVLQAALELGAPNYTLSSDRIILLCPPAEKPSDMPYRCLEELWSKAGMPKRLTAEREKETAYLCYSPGTAGKARGVMTSHHNVTSQVQAYDRVYGPLRHGDGILGTIPLSDMYGLTLLLHHPLTLGVPVIILPKFEPNRAIKAIRRFKITWAPVAPQDLIQLGETHDPERKDISILRGVQVSAGPCSPGMIKAFLDGFPKKTLAGGMSSRPGEHPVAVTQGYGLTEATPFSHVMNLAEGVAHVGQVGKIMPTMQARLVDIESGIDVGEGEPGELWLRGPSVMRGYWKDDEATKSAFAEGGWFKTGDVAVADEHEYFTILDRVRDLIKFKGYQVSPSELEALLKTYPTIHDACVVGVRDSTQVTELPRAYIVPKGGLDAVPSDKRKDYAADVAKWVEERVANHKQLRGGVVLVDGIPKSPSGNVLRERLRMVARGELELNEVTSQGKQMQRNLVAGEREEGRSEDSQAREEATGREEAYL